MPRKQEALQHIKEELLSPKEREYMSLRKQGWTYQRIADRYGVSRQCVHQAISRGKNRTVSAAKGAGRPKDPMVQKIKAEELLRKLEKRKAQKLRLKKDLDYVDSRICLLNQELQQAKAVLEQHHVKTEGKGEHQNQWK